MTKAVYLDSSALVKLAVQEPESDALRRHLRRRVDWVSSALRERRCCVLFYPSVVKPLLPAGEYSPDVTSCASMTGCSPSPER